jgi:hypothetical protein
MSAGQQPKQGSGSTLTRETIFSALSALSDELGKQGVMGEICLFSGTVMVLAFTARLATKDVDALFQPAQTIRELARHIAADQHLPVDWLNDGVKGFVSGRHDTTAGNLPQFPHLRLTMPVPEYLSHEVHGCTDRRGSERTYGRGRHYFSHQTLKTKVRERSFRSCGTILSSQSHSSQSAVSCRGFVGRRQNMRPKTLMEVAELVIGGDAFDRCLANFLDEFYAAPNASALADAPALLAPQFGEPGHVQDAYLAATAEELARAYQISAPDWVAADTRKLHRPWFASQLAALRAVLILESPAAFRSRNLFISQNALSRA